MSNWDVGRQPADHHDGSSFRDNDLAYPMGGVQWTGSRDWTDAGAGGSGNGGGSGGYGDSGGPGGLDDLDSAPYPITYERDLDEFDDPRPPATQYEPYAPWPPAQPPDDRFAPEDKFPPAPVPPAAFAGDEFATAQFAADPYAASPYAADPYAAGPRAAGDQLADEPWLRAPAPGARPSAEPPRTWTDEQWQSAAEWPPQPGRRPAQPDQGWPRPGDGPSPSRRWLMYAGVAVAATAIGGAAVLLTGGHPHSQAAGTPARTATPPASGGAAGRPAAQKASPASKTSATPKASKAPSISAVSAAPLSMAQAHVVLAGYTSVNNHANAKRDDAQLATIETGSSYAIDAGLYLMQGSAGVAPYPAFAPVSSTYYIPASESANGPRWFVVRVSNAFLSSPKKVSSSEYLLFTQATPGGPWKNTIEPYLISSASVPQPAIGGNGLATPVTATTSSLATSPDQLPTLTAASLNGTGAIANPGNLQESSDRQFWQGKLPSATVTDTHALVTGNEGKTFALRTTGGGALVFYTDAATLTITPPAGTVLHLTVPGIYSSAQSLTSASLSYLDQFAAYDPPAGSGTPSIVADYSGITGKA